ncbi:hypothetical protein DE146DRAFT_275794 [Phaeosphaeria sp. MPI-PUGE-AT-0046c]|nr:hypothetical protein DE146DRAFT_275794 [Phaeosphaeria sp. MPI-PUGE-AT-0046c]
MRNLYGCRLVLLVAPSLLLLFPIGVLTLALERISNALLREQTSRNWRSGDSEVSIPNPTSSADTSINIQVKNAPTYAILGICCLSYLVSAIGVFGMWELRKVEGTSRHQRGWSWAVLVSHVIMIGASVGVLAWASSVQSDENSWLRREDIGQGSLVLTRETWACQIDKFYTDSGWAGAACGTAKGTRFLLIAMAVSSVLALVTLWVIVRQRGGLKWLSGGKGRYGGFDNVYELQPNTSGAPYVFQPAPQWTTQPYHQWTPQSYQQWHMGANHSQWAQQPPQHAPQQPTNAAPGTDTKIIQPVFR